MKHLMNSSKRRSTGIEDIPDEDKFVKRKSSGRRTVKIWKGEVFNTIEIEKNYKKKEPIDEE